MNLVSYSIKTKGTHNFTRRLRTVFTRFGFSEAQMRHALYTVIETLHTYGAAPTFFIPAVVLRRHPSLLTEITRRGVEVGVHGYVHNDYRTLNKAEQYTQTQQAIAVFEQTHIPYSGFRNPYLGWTEESLEVYSDLGFAYESNEAVLHDIIDIDKLSPPIRDGYEKSLALFQAMPCSSYALRPHFEGNLLRIPTSIPDDEMLFDRLRITKPEEVGMLWSKVMSRVYDMSGLYTLNLHPERGILCQQALNILLTYAYSRPQPVWITRLGEIAQWWKERNQFRLTFTPLGEQRWLITASCTPRARLLARHITIEDATTVPWSPLDSHDSSIAATSFTICATHCPCIALSPETPQAVADFLHEQGYPTVRCIQTSANLYTLYLDMHEGLGKTRQERLQRRKALVEEIERLEKPLVRFGNWPNGNRAALAISGDIDSVTVQDFFLRILEVSR
ncbi:MAG TPA: polysaccharide deacetylase family protein [Ktedonobacteraceae bacterium]|nr:polysaccharide deacetylase family protein [Ktedonobacteraceae bacterium]